MKISIVGYGNVGSFLAKALLAIGCEIVEIVVRNVPTDKDFDNFTSNFDLRESHAELILIAVKDEAVAEVASRLLLRDGVCVAHTSGSIPIEAISEFHQNAAVFYPLQTFSKGKNIDWKKVPICIEANHQNAKEKLLALARLISDNVFQINSTQRSEIHLAAVMVCNFSNLLYILADELLAEKQLPFSILKPLIEETVEKALNMPPIQAQTGPAKRGDKTVIEKHLAMLEDKKDVQQIYKILSEAIMKRF